MKFETSLLIQGTWAGEKEERGRTNLSVNPNSMNWFFLPKAKHEVLSHLALSTLQFLAKSAHFQKSSFLQAVFFSFIFNKKPVTVNPLFKEKLKKWTFGNLKDRYFTENSRAGQRRSEQHGIKTHAVSQQRLR